MFSKCIPCTRLPLETLDVYCRRRKREARNRAVKMGLWSKIWCKRILNWDAHLTRARDPCRPPHIINNLLDFHGQDWLVQQRSPWVVSNSRFENPRNSVWAGRTGTRLNIGRPQTRWVDGVTNAKVIESLNATGDPGHAITVGTLYSPAHGLVRSAVAYLQSDA